MMTKTQLEKRVAELEADLQLTESRCADGLLKAIGLRQAVEFAIASLPYPNQHPTIARRLKQALLATEGWESVTLRSALDDEYDIITLDGEAITDIQQQMGSNYTCLIGGRHTNLHETSVVYVRRR